jgi:hypothetical protein
MVFKKPTGSRDDRPNRSSDRPKSGGDKSKRSSSSSAGKPFGQSGRTDGKKSFSVDKRTSSYQKPNTGKPESEGERPKRSFGASSSFGEKKAYIPKGKPYSGRPTPTGQKRALVIHHPAKEKAIPLKTNHTAAGLHHQITKVLKSLLLALHHTVHAKTLLRAINLLTEGRPVPTAAIRSHTQHAAAIKNSAAAAQVQKISPAHLPVTKNVKVTIQGNHQNQQCAGVKTRL